MTACEYLSLDSADAFCIAAFFIVLRMLSKPLALVESPPLFLPSFSEDEDRELELVLWVAVFVALILACKFALKSTLRAEKVVYVSRNSALLAPQKRHGAGANNF